MIDVTLRYVRNELNEYLQRRGNYSDPVALSNIQSLDGANANRLTDKIIISLIKADHDVSGGRQPVASRTQDLEHYRRVPPLPLNLYLLASANFGNYEDGLKYLSATIAFFNSHSPFDPQRSPLLPKGISQLDLHIENLSIHDLSTLWGVLGGTHLPSMYYKARVVSIDTAEIERKDPIIVQIDQAVRP